MPACKKVNPSASPDLSFFSEGKAKINKFLSRHFDLFSCGCGFFLEWPKLLERQQILTLFAPATRFEEDKSDEESEETADDD